MGASFSGDTRFVGVSFSGAARFGGASFSGDAWFVGASFSGTARFGGAVFGGAARFDRAEFGADARFHNAEFKGPANFTKARFRGMGRFGEAVFSGAVEFGGTSFADTARFAGARFDAAPHLGPLVCGRLLDLSAAVFTEPVTIEAAAAEIACRMDPVGVHGHTAAQTRQGRPDRQPPDPTDRSRRTVHPLRVRTCPSGGSPRFRSGRPGGFDPGRRRLHAHAGRPEPRRVRLHGRPAPRPAPARRAFGLRYDARRPHGHGAWSPSAGPGGRSSRRSGSGGPCPGEPRPRDAAGALLRRTPAPFPAWRP